MKILDFTKFTLLLEADDPAAAPAPPPADAGGMAPPPPAPAPPPALGGDMGAPAPAAGGPVQPTTTDMKFIFIQEAGKKEWHGHHDSDGGTKRFTMYKVTADEFTKWLEVHKLDQDKDLALAALAGRRKMPENLYKEFKKEVVDGTLGSDQGSLDVTFDSDTDLSNPSTDDLDVVFLRSR